MRSIHHQNCPLSHVIVCLLHHHGYPIAALCPFSFFSFIIRFLLQVFLINPTTVLVQFYFFIVLYFHKLFFVVVYLSILTLVWLLSKQLNIYRSTVERPRAFAHVHCRLKIMHTMRTTRE